MEWVLKNRTALGALLFALAQVLRAAPDVPHGVIEALTAIGSFLTGAGALPSDSAREKFGAEAK